MHTTLHIHLELDMASVCKREVVDAAEGAAVLAPPAPSTSNQWPHGRNLPRARDKGERGSGHTGGRGWSVGGEDVMQLGERLRWAMRGWLGKGHGHGVWWGAV